MTDVLTIMAPIELIDQLADMKMRVHRTHESVLRHQLSDRVKLLQNVADRVVPNDDNFRAVLAAFEEASTDLSAVLADMHRCERQNDFGPGFIALTRSYLATHDERERLRAEMVVQLEPVDTGIAGWPDRSH